MRHGLYVLLNSGILLCENGNGIKGSRAVPRITKICGSISPAFYLNNEKCGIVPPELYFLNVALLYLNYIKSWNCPTKIMNNASLQHL